MNDPLRSQLEALGAYIRTQRRLAKLSLREVAELSRISNAYISQIERGLHEPSLRVLQALAEALNVPPDDLLEAAGLLRDDAGAEAQPQTEAAIRSDSSLTESQREALLAVYRSFRPPSGSRS